MQYLFKRNDDVTQYSTKKLLMLLFTDDPKRIYKDQKEIASALSKYYVTRTQSAVSKALKSYLGKEFKYKNKRYLLLKTDMGYEIFSPDDAATYSIADLLSKRSLKPYVFCESALEHPEGFVLWMSDHAKEDITETMQILRVIIGKDNYLDIFSVDNKIIVLLDRRSPSFVKKSTQLKSLFTDTKRPRLTKAKYKKRSTRTP